MSKKGILVSSDDDNFHSFEYPATPDYFSDKYYDALELMNVGRYADAEPILRDIVETCPDHIDAIAHLSMILKEKGYSIEALALAEYAVNRGKSYLPKDFKPGKSKLPYGVLDNRGYLRACHTLGLEYLERVRYKEALAIFKDIIAINPDDNQGIRELLIRCYFELKSPEEALKVCNNYRDDTFPSVLWGRTLALYQVGKLKEAEEAARKAFSTMPKAGKRLLKKKNDSPKHLSKSHITHGGDDQAYYFKKDFGKYWDETPGALTFLKGQINK